MKMTKEQLAERREDLRFLQSESLGMKVQNTIAKVMEFYQRTGGECYLSCSGGADSVVLWHIIKELNEWLPRKMEIPVVFDDTGLEEPSVRARALEVPNVQVVRPKISFFEVLTKIGYPVISKETAECVNNARKYFDNIGRERERERESRLRPKYFSHYKKLFGIGEYATKSSKNIGSVAKNDLENKSVVWGFP